MHERSKVKQLPVVILVRRDFQIKGGEHCT